MVLSIPGGLFGQDDVRETNSLNTTSTPKAASDTIIQSIQHGVIAVSSTSNTATIDAVVTENSVVVFNGNTHGASRPADTLCKLTLTDETTVTASRINDYNTCNVSYMVIEYIAGVVSSKQLGHLLNEGDYTITTVDTSKAMCFVQGATSPDESSTFTQSSSYNAFLSAADTVTVNVQDVETTVWFTVVEFN